MAICRRLSLIWGSQRNRVSARLNLRHPAFVKAPEGREMTFLKKLFGKEEPKTRVRVCVECGMPIAEHRDWCSILRGQKEMEAKSKTA